jgi:signal peptidase I
MEKNHKKVNLSGYLAAGEPVSMVLRGSSMFPFITDGSLAFIEPLPQSFCPKLGAIVLVQLPRGLALHRVIRADKDEVLIKGDWNLTPDSLARQNEIIGVCSLILRKGRLINLRSPLWRAYGAVYTHLLRVLRFRNLLHHRFNSI